MGVNDLTVTETQPLRWKPKKFRNTIVDVGMHDGAGVEQLVVQRFLFWRWNAAVELFFQQRLLLQRILQRFLVDQL